MTGIDLEHWILKRHQRRIPFSPSVDLPSNLFAGRGFEVVAENLFLPV